MITRNSDDEGELKFRNVPNYEMPTDADADNHYDITVKVSDNGSLNAMRGVTLTVTNVDEPGTASFSGALLGGSTLTANGDGPGWDDQRHPIVPVAAGEHVIREPSRTSPPMGPPRRMCRWPRTWGNT